MILTSCSDKSYFVASIQVMSRDKFILLRDITFMLHRWLHYTMTAKQVNAAIDVFLVNIMKSISSSYVQNMIENMILTPYPDKFFIASIQMMLCDKLNHQVRRQFLTIMSYWSLVYTS